MARLLYCTLLHCTVSTLQVVFEGGANIVGVVEGVQMTRTLLVSTDCLTRMVHPLGACHEGLQNCVLK